MQSAIKKCDARFTYADYAGWPDGERWELIDGEAYDMSPAPSRSHQDISIKLEERILQFLAGKKGPCRMYHAPFDVLLPEGDESDDETITVVQPDIIVVCDNKKLTKKGCRGAPDFIVEILSPATATKDMREKLHLYELHGVKEYWIVDPHEKFLLAYLPGPDGAYLRPAIYGQKDKLASNVLEGFTVDCALLFADSDLELTR